MEDEFLKCNELKPSFSDALFWTAPLPDVNKELKSFSKKNLHGFQSTKKDKMSVQTSKLHNQPFKISQEVEKKQENGGLSSENSLHTGNLLLHDIPYYLNEILYQDMFTGKALVTWLTSGSQAVLSVFDFVQEFCDELLVAGLLVDQCVVKSLKFSQNRVYSWRRFGKHKNTNSTYSQTNDNTLHALTNDLNGEKSPSVDDSVIVFTPRSRKSFHSIDTTSDSISVKAKEAEPIANFSVPPKKVESDLDTDYTSCPSMLSPHGVIASPLVSSLGHGNDFIEICGGDKKTSLVNQGSSCFSSLSTMKESFLCDYSEPHVTLSAQHCPNITLSATSEYSSVFPRAALLSGLLATSMVKCEAAVTCQPTSELVITSHSNPANDPPATPIPDTPPPPPPPPPPPTPPLPRPSSAQVNLPQISLSSSSLSPTSPLVPPPPPAAPPPLAPPPPPMAPPPAPLVSVAPPTQGNDVFTKKTKKLTKPLYWTKISLDKHCNHEKYGEVWKNMEKEKINENELDDLFAKQDVVKTANDKEAAKKNSKKVSTAKILETKRSQAVAIFKSSLHIGTDEVLKAIIDVDTSTVDIETMEAIYELRPQGNELQKINSHVKRQSALPMEKQQPLDKPEEFLYQLWKTPYFTEIVFCIIFTEHFHYDVQEVMKIIDVIDRTCAVLQSKEILKLFGVILSIGNYLNKGHYSRGGAQGFKLDILSKLKDVKTNNNSNLLSYIAKTYISIVCQQEEVADVSCPLPSALDVVRSSHIQFDELQHDIKKIHKRLIECDEKARRIMKHVSKDEYHAFFKFVEEFLSKAACEIDTARNRVASSKNNFQLTVKYFGISKDAKAKDFFDHWVSFCTDFHAMWSQELHKVMAEKKKAAKSQLEERRSSRNVQKGSLNSLSLKARLGNK